MNVFLEYAARRFGQFVFVVVTGITLAFIIAHLSPVDPVEQSLSLMTGFSASDPRAIEILRQSLSELYGVKGGLLDHYLVFWRRVLTGDFGPSLSAFPTPVMTIILRAMPWTFGLLVLSTLFAWIVGNMLGALAGYFRDSRLLKAIGIAVMALQPMPTYIVRPRAGDLSRLPLADLSDQRRRPDQPPAGARLDFVSSVVVHGTLPALTLVLVGLGGVVHLDALAGLQRRDRRSCRLCRTRGRSPAHHLQPLRRPQRHAAADHRAGAQSRPRLRRRRDRRIPVRLSRHGPAR